MAHGFLNGAKYGEDTMILVQMIEGTLAEIVVPAGTKKIGAYAFDNISSLKKIIIPEGVERIGSNALAWTGIAELELPLSCRTIDSLALLGIWSCKTMKMGNVTSIGEKAFVQCNDLVELDFTRCDSVPALASTNVFDNYVLKNNPKILVPAELYGEWVAATNWSQHAERIVPVYDAPEVVVPDRVSEGLDFTLCGNEWDRYYEVAGLGTCADEVLVIPSEHNGVPVTGLRSYCFSGNTSIKEVYIPESIIEFGYAFENCTNLEKIYVDASGISSFEFCNISPLKYVKFGRLTFLGGGTFADCTDAVFDFFECTAIPEFDSYGYGSEFGANPMVVVPLALYDEWKVNTNWAMYADHIVAAK